jgi:hypothetical protein
VKLLALYYPLLDSQSNKPAHKRKLMQKIRLSKQGRHQDEELHQQLEAICAWLKREFTSDLDVQRYGKFCLPGGTVLRSRLSENQGKPPERSAHYFQAEKGGSSFGEALAFLEIIECSQQVVVYQPLEQVGKMLSAIKGKWLNGIQVMPVLALHSIIGVFCFGERVYVLPKHAGLNLLGEEEKGIKIQEIYDDDGQSGDID